MEFIKELFGEMFDKEDKDKPKEISVNGNLLIFPTKIIQISNISKMSSYVIKKAWMIRLIILSISVALWYYSYNNNFMLFLALCFFIAFIYMLRYKRYGVRIQTNGSTNDLLITKNQDFADRLLAMIAYAINNKEELLPLTIENYYLNPTLVKGDQIFGDKFSDLENSNIMNRSNVN